MNRPPASTAGSISGRPFRRAAARVTIHAPIALLKSSASGSRRASARNLESAGNAVSRSRNADGLRLMGH